MADKTAKAHACVSKSPSISATSNASVAMVLARIDPPALAYNALASAICNSIRRRIFT
jgi:hypothetical protein